MATDWSPSISTVYVLCNSDASGKFPEFPDAEDGGSEAIFKKREEVS